MRRVCLLLLVLLLPVLGGRCARQAAPLAPSPPLSAPTPAVSSTPGEAPPQTPPPGAAAQVLNYELQAEITPAKHYLAAVALMHWHVHRATSQLTFNLRPNLQITSLTIDDGRPLAFDRAGEGALSVSLGTTLEPGAQPVLRVEYEGEIYGPRAGRRGERLLDYLGKEGTYVRHEAQWYPQVLGDTATADVTLTVPPDWVAVTSGQLVDVGEQSWHWRTDIPVAGLSFAAGEYVLTEAQAGRVPLRCYAFARHAGQAPELLDKFGKMLSFFEKRYGPYPFPQVSVVEIPDLYGGGYGAPSLLMLPEQAYRDSFDEEFAARELARNWWGTWLQCSESRFPVEGFVTYSPALWQEHQGGAPALQATMQRQAEAVLRASLAARDEKSCFAADDGPLLQEKGAWILHMSRRQLGDDAWFRAVRRFAVAYGGREFTVADLREALETEGGRSLVRFFQQWVYGRGVPWVRGAVVTGETGRPKLRLSQVYVAEERETEAAWRTAPSSFELPVEVLLRHGARESRQVCRLTRPVEDFTLSVTEKITGVVVDPDGWLLEHSKGPVGDWEAEVSKLNEELDRGPGKDSRDLPG